MRVRPGILALLALAWLSCTGAFLGCDLFKPEEPERATNPAPAVRVDLSDPDSTLTTMARAMAAKVDGVSAYMETIAQIDRDGADFVVEFDPLVLALRPVPPGTWTPERERQFFGGFTADFGDAEFEMVWEVDAENPDDPQSNPRVLHRRYRVYANTASSRDLIADGFAVLTFKVTSGRYVIQHWKDRVASPESQEISFSWQRLERA